MTAAKGPPQTAFPQEHSTAFRTASSRTFLCSSAFFLASLRFAFTVFVPPLFSADCLSVLGCRWLEVDEALRLLAAGDPRNASRAATRGRTLSLRTAGSERCWCSECS